MSATIEDARCILTPWLPRFGVMVQTENGKRLAGYVTKELNKKWRATGRLINPDGTTAVSHHGDHEKRSDAVAAVEAYYFAHSGEKERIDT